MKILVSKDLTKIYKFLIDYFDAVIVKNYYRLYKMHMRY